MPGKPVADRLRGWALAGVCGAAVCAPVPTRLPLAAPAPGAAEGAISVRSAAQADSLTRSYALALGQTAVQPTLLQGPAPSYPPALLSAHLPALDVPVQLAINGQGQVTHVVVAGEAQADPQRRAFIAAIRSAVLAWRYSPLIIQRFAADADGNSHLVDESRPSFSQYYVFHFELRDGVPVSSSQSAAAPAGP